MVSENQNENVKRCLCVRCVVYEKIDLEVFCAIYACIALFSSIFRTDCLKNEAMLGKRELQFVIFTNFRLQ